MQISQTTIPIWPNALVMAPSRARRLEARLRAVRLRALLGRVLLMLLDAVMVTLAFNAAYYIRFVLLRGVRFTTTFLLEPLAAFQRLQIVVTVGMLVFFALKGLYRLRPTGTWFKQFWIVVSATTIAFAVFSAYAYVFHSTDLFVSQQRALVALTWVSVVLLVSLARLGVAGLLAILYQRGIGLTNVLVVGSGRLGKLIMQQITAHAHLGYRVVGFISELEGESADFGRFKALGTLAQIDGVIRAHHVTEVIIALPSHQHRQILRTVRISERAGADFKLVPDLYELSLSRIDVDALEGIPLIGLRRNLISSWRYRAKRLVDIVGALALLVLTAPLWALIALAIKLDSPGPVLLRQRRIGYQARSFRCYKFRSMHDDTDQQRGEAPHAALVGGAHDAGNERGKFKLRFDPRCTRVGRFIRRMSLDELPQLLNVLRGDMSLVGPRPPLPEEYARYEEWEKARLEMPPGVSGLWQVRGRSDLDFSEMVLLDLYYIENWSLRLDLQILLQTIPAVISRRGAY
jgi:exopolysaccharide biosynthesis polyprenyl glycosylphosphotransferase